MSRLDPVLCDHASLRYDFLTPPPLPLRACNNRHDVGYVPIIRTNERVDDLGAAFSQFLPIIIEDGLGFNTLQAQYLTIPVQLWGAIIYMFIAWLSDKYRKRFLFMAIFTPICALGYLLQLCPIPAGAQYFATFLITGGVYIISGNNLAWASSNAAPDGKRGATVGIVLTLTDLAGNSILLALPSSSLLLVHPMGTSSINYHENGKKG